MPLNPNMAGPAEPKFHIPLIHHLRDFANHDHVLPFFFSKVMSQGHLLHPFNHFREGQLTACD